MRCPKCNNHTAVGRTNGAGADRVIMRYRKCLKCKYSFVTREEYSRDVLPRGQRKPASEAP